MAQNRTSNELKPDKPTEKRQLIKNAAITLFVQKGLGVSTSAITSSAQVSSGLLFHYFPTKNDLILDLYADVLGEFNQVTARTPTLTQGEREAFKDNLRAEVEASWDWCLDNWEKYQFMQLVNGSAIANQVLIPANERAREERQNATALLAEMRKHVRLRDIPDGLLYDAISTNIKFVAEYMHEHPEARNDRAFRDAAWRMYWDTIAGVDL